MKVLDYLDELEEILGAHSAVPLLSKKVLVDRGDMLEIIKDIRDDLPDEIRTAQWVMEEREKLLEEAKIEYDKVIAEAKRQAELKVENSEIVVNAKKRATEIATKNAEECRQLRLRSYAYIDSKLAELENTTEQLYAGYFADMWKKMESTFGDVSLTIAKNRQEMQELSYNLQMDNDEFL